MNDAVVLIFNLIKILICMVKELKIISFYVFMRDI
jgi:hypothetical protein